MYRNEYRILELAGAPWKVNWGREKTTGRDEPIGVANT
jgi:hypothetical protein